MHNLQKTIRYGFWLILEVIALCVGMIYSARTVRAEPEAQMSDFAWIFNISGKEKVLFSAAMKNILNIDPEGQQPARKVTEVVTEKWTVISGKRLDLILKYMGDINFEKEGISLRIPASVAQSWKVAENGTIQALVQKVSNHSYEIKIYKGTQKITDIPGSRIMIPVKEMFPNGDPETMEITDSRGRKLKTFLDKKQDLLIVDTDETGIFCVRGRKIDDDIEETPFAVAVLTTATMITVLIVGIRSRSGKRGDSHKGEK